MSILEGVPNFATELNDALVVFFWKGDGDQMRNKKRHPKTEKTPRRSSQTMRNTAMFLFIKVESRRRFSTRVVCIGMCKRQLTPKKKTNDNNDSSCDNNENNSRCDIAISISHDNKQQLFVLEW